MFSFLYFLRNSIKGCDESEHYGLRIGWHKNSKYNPARDDAGGELFTQSKEECESIYSRIITFLQMTQSASETDHSDLTWPDGKGKSGMQEGPNQS